jgi:hypothetical protein
MQYLVSVTDDKTGSANRSGNPVFTDGPFVAEGSKHCNRKVEVRPFLG